MGSEQGSTYEDPDAGDVVDRMTREATLQRLLDELTARLEGTPEHDVYPELDRTLASEGFVDMPPRWREAAAAGISEGTGYVVSADTDRTRGTSSGG